MRRVCPVDWRRSVYLANRLITWHVVNTNSFCALSVRRFVNLKSRAVDSPRPKSLVELDRFYHLSQASEVAIRQTVEETWAVEELSTVPIG